MSSDCLTKTQDFDKLKSLTPAQCAITKKKILKRFELNLLYNNPFNTFLEYDKDTRKLINILLSQIVSVNNQINEIQKANLIRLYLTKTYRGRAQALGKPSRGQRT